MVYFKELRSGKDLPYLIDRTIKFNEWSGGQRSSHLFNKSVMKNSFFTVYDYDLKMEMMAILFIIGLYLKN